MELGTILAIAGIVVGVAAIVVGVFAARRWGNRRRRVLVTTDVVSLTPNWPLEPTGLLQVVYQGAEVKDPQLASISIRNVGPSDIASGHFDAGRPIAVDLHCVMYGLIKTSHPDATVASKPGGNGVIELRPTLLRRGDAWSVQALVQGSPRPTIASSLVDTDLVDRRSFTPGPVLRVLRLAIETVSPAAAVLVRPW